MRPKKNMPTNAVDLFRSRLDQIINLKHELAQLAGKIDWNWLDEQIAPLYSETGRPAVETRFMLGLLLLKHISACPTRRSASVGEPHFQYFTGEEFFQHCFPHEGFGLSHWRKRLGDRLELLRGESLRVPMAAARCGLATWRGSRWIRLCNPRTWPSRPTPSCCRRHSTA
jgi:IS5 family transposase